MPGTVDVVVDIPGKIIGEETDSHDLGHDDSAFGQQAPLGPCQECCLVLVSRKDRLEEPGVAIHLLQVPLIFLRGVGGGTEHVSRVEEDGTRHDGIQVYQAKHLSAVLVEEHIVQLGIVVGDMERKDALFHTVPEHASASPALHEETNLVAYRGEPPLRVPPHRRFQLPVAHAHVVEVGNRLREPMSIQRAEQVVETADGTAELIGLAGVGQLLIGLGTFDEGIDPPVPALLVHHIGFPLP